MKINWTTIYKAFPVNKEMIWLNNCGTTPAGKHIVKALSRFIEGYAQKGVLTEVAVYPEVQNNIKKILGNLLNCSPDELSLIHNTAEGMNFISHGLNLSIGDEVILLENEYPSNVYPWRHLKEKGVKLIITPMKSSPEAFLKALERLITKKTRVVSLSAVHWCTGMPFPLNQVGKLCIENGIDFVVDGAQGVGMQPIDTKKDNISYMAFSAWKWLLGPLGMGILFVAKEKLTELKPVFIGTDSVVRADEYLPYKSELKPSADRFTFSTANFNDWVYLEASLKFLHDIGFVSVRERIFELSARLRKGLTKIGFNVFSNQFPDYQTGIVVCEKPGVNPDVIMTHLKRNRIVAAKRLGRVRFSPHVYNSTEQIDEVIRVLEQV
ncbi:MAG: aminotransferase class V-fold PLP-dependent enzyme [Desulfobacterales bacterium]|nr:aminotransferase class V-fold PLP-dependent enzyme [Desulfobacterales bacterium]MDX2508718.1 aminotransferase class V-fold PLP-dependent enzyme [Desulfobacterales bacterium]